MTVLLRNLLLYFLLPVLCSAPAFADASSAITFAEESRLSTGRWVKVSVTADGMHRITATSLSAMGFSGADRVKVYGYGGRRLSDVLSAADVVDDLPQTPSVVEGGDIVFYARGPVDWSETANGSGKYIHAMNPFSHKGYYYLTENDEERLGPTPSSYPVVSDDSGAATTFRERLLYHNEQASLAYSGFTFLSDDLTKGTMSTTFTLAGLAPGSAPAKVWARVGVASYTSGEIQFRPSFTPELRSTSSTNVISVSKTSTSSYIKGTVTSADYSATDFSGETLLFSIGFTGGDKVTLARLHYVDVCYDRQLSLGAGGLNFRLRSSKAALTAPEGVRVWDVTSPLQPVEMLTRSIADGGTSRAVWQNLASGLREYAAWIPGGALPAPVTEGVASNQNLHSTADNPHMVIFTTAGLRSAAEELAAYRRGAPSHLDVKVVTLEEVYPEFSSGNPDVQAFRRYLKMLWSRPDSRLRYALFMGRPVWDARGVTPESRGGECSGERLLTWETINSTNEFTLSYPLWDLYGFLDDGTSSNSSRAVMRIAVGVMPSNNLTQALEAVAKIKDYEKDSRRGSWRGKAVITSDSSPEGYTFMQQCDGVESMLLSTGPATQLAGSGSGFSISKIYLDAYAIINGQTVAANEELRNSLSDGVAWLFYIGHASHTAWGGAGLMPYAYASSMTLPRKPLVFAATCDYGALDGPTLSGGEAMWRNTGGPAAVMCATRSVGVTSNGPLAYHVAESIGCGVSEDYPGETGALLTVGQVLQRAKNRLVQKGYYSQRENAFRFILIGDPAMKQSVPPLNVRLEQITDLTTGRDYDLDGDTPPALPGGARLQLAGTVTTQAAETVEDFNGEVELTLYDGLFDTTSYGYNCKEYTFAQQGPRLSVVRAAVNAGRWTALLNVPKEISNNNTEAVLAMYASTSDNCRDALGADRRFTVNGFCETAGDDTPPAIEALYLNHAAFRSGDSVNPAPMLYARISDDTGINISDSGLGRAMTLTLDGTARTYSDLANHFSPDFGACTSGLVAYPLSELSEGLHTLTLTVWDLSDNSASASINFRVDPTAAPAILDVYTDANPATESANFYVVHDRPDKDVEVTVEVYDLMGRTVWKRTVTTLSEGNTAQPVNWDLRTGGGARVVTGIYLYRATLSLPGGEAYATKSHRIAVAPK